MTILLFFIIPVKIKWLAYVNAAFFLINIFTTSFLSTCSPSWRR